MLLTSGRASDKLRKELLFFMEIQSNLMLGGKTPSKMISDGLRQVPAQANSGTHTHFCGSPGWSALLLSPWKQWDIVNAFTDTSG